MSTTKSITQEEFQQMSPLAKRANWNTKISNPKPTPKAIRFLKKELSFMEQCTLSEINDRLCEEGCYPHYDMDDEETLNPDVYEAFKMQKKKWIGELEEHLSLVRKFAQKSDGDVARMGGQERGRDGGALRYDEIICKIIKMITKIDKSLK